MEKQWVYLLFLLWFFYLIVTQVLLFTNGFLLTRVAQLKNSTCVHLNCETNTQCLNDDAFISEHLHNASSICLDRKAKVILLIVDALRHDFTLYNTSITNPAHYQNKLPVIAKLQTLQPEQARLYKFIADPPTTTMQRIKGFTTGSLPTFIDAGSNFATREINEDNLIDQVISNGYSAIFMGDDTWNGLYPKRFKRNYPYPSFNVWDLDSVDNGVKSNLFPEIKQDDWSLLIGHFLGVDHCGHRYGPDHPEMDRKLTEVNGVIENVVDTMDNDTVLFVIGDHGMTSTGDHGGESENEITAAMFVYSKTPLSPLYYNHNKTVRQVDIVPTLSTILGIPVPYSNLGAIIHDTIPVVTNNWKHHMFATWGNILQLTNYIKEYSEKTNTFQAQRLEDIYKQYNELHVKARLVSTEEDFKNFTSHVHNYISEVRAMCEEVWIQFDAYSMARGLLILSHVTILAFLLIDGLSNHGIKTIISPRLIITCYTTIALSISVSFILHFAHLVSDLNNTIYFTGGISSICILATLVVQNFQAISLNLYNAGKSRKWPDVVCRVVVAFSFLMLFTNSFIVEEPKVMLFFLLSLIAVLLLEFGFLRLAKGRDLTIKTATKNKAVIFSLVICVLIRISLYFWRCREGTGCEDFVSAKGGSRTEWFLSIIALALFVTGCRIWLRSCGNLNGSSVTVLLARYAPTVGVVCCAGFWVLHQLPKDTKVRLIGPWQPDMLAWVVYFLTASGFVSLIFQPLCVYQLPKQKEIEVNSSNIIPQLAKHVFSSNKKNHMGVPTVYGLATAYSATFIIISVNFVLLWALLLGDIVVPSCIAIMFVAGLILVLTAMLQYEKAKSIEDLLEVPSCTVLLWYIMSIYLFYATGHQPTFTNIAWEAAFVGTGGVFVNNFIPAILVIINTFGSYIVMGLSLPLILIAPFSLYVMVPTLSSKKTKLDLARGDMELYDSNDILFDNIFKICCKYIMCHTLRVFASMLSATIHCRHLMVWNIFAPKFIFEAIGLFVSAGAVLIGFALLIHVHNKVDRFIKYLTKQFS